MTSPKEKPTKMTFWGCPCGRFERIIGEGFRYEAEEAKGRRMGTSAKGLGREGMKHRAWRDLVFRKGSFSKRTGPENQRGGSLEEKRGASLTINWGNDQDLAEKNAKESIRHAGGKGE